MNRGQIRDAARLLISETDSENSHFNDSDLDNLINEWQRDAAIRVRSPRKEATQNTVQDQETYATPPDYLSSVVLMIEDLDGKEEEIPFVHFEDLRSIFGRRWISDVAGTPRVYYFSDRDVLGIHPKPDADHGGKVMRLFYIPVPTDMTNDGDVPDIEEVFHQHAKHFVAAEAHASVQNMAMSDKMMARYESKMQQFKEQGRSGSEAENAWSWEGSDGDIIQNHLHHGEHF